MININSNIDKIIDCYKIKANNFNKAVNEIPEILSKKMIDEMVNIIVSEKNIWQQQSSVLELVGGDDFEIIKNKNSCIVYIGRNTKKIITSDGTSVNPYFFIEFGFGIRGEDNPKKNHDLLGWQYNVKKHTKQWFYIGIDGERHYTKGKIGLNFLYDVLQKYSIQWKNIAFKYLKENV